MTTGIITTVAGNGIAGFSGDGGPATSTELNFPDGVGLDASDNVYIGDALNNRVRKLDVTTGIITTVAGTGVAGFSGDGGLGTNAELNFPSRPALDAAGNLYIADFQNNRVRRVDATTHVIVTVAGTGTAAYSGDGGPARDADLSGPISVTVDTSGNLYVGDTNNARIRVVNTGTNTITVAGIAIQPATIVTIAGNGIIGYLGDGGPATNAELNFPTGLLLDPAGNLYFADAKSNVVRAISLQ
jgi:sugar lactone lactonase YvrE